MRTIVLVLLALLASCSPNQEEQQTYQAARKIVNEARADIKRVMGLMELIRQQRDEAYDLAEQALEQRNDALRAMQACHRGTL